MLRERRCVTNHSAPRNTSTSNEKVTTPADRSPATASCGLQAADAPRARQSSAASGKPARLGGTVRRARTRNTGGEMKSLSCNRVFQRRSAHTICPALIRWKHLSIGVCTFLFAAVFTPGQTRSARPISNNEGSTKPPAIVIGFVGGFIAHDNPVHSEVQLAAHLRKEYPAGVVVETFESYRGERAQREIRKLLDTNHDGTLAMEEKQNARIIIYGHSWGGAESIYLARALEKDGIPVLLTLQVDSISRPGRDDTTITANVAQAANFYQAHGLLRGHHDIRAADPGRTRIIGNFLFDYDASPLKCSEYPWYDRIFVKPHTQIECDPAVWDQVESLIRSNFPPELVSEAAR
jgi:hypothetical protein